MKSYIVEFIGTFFLVLVIGLAGNPFAIGAGLMVMVYVGGHISGGHYNPAVTFAVYLSKKINLNQVLPYIAAQLLGAFFAAATVIFLSGMNFMGPSPASDISVPQAFLAEFLFTFALCLVVLAVATSNKIKGNYIYGLAIGSAVLVGAFSVGEISGGAFNPAVGTGPALYQLLINGNNEAIFSSWLYWVAPLLAAATAALIHTIIEKN